MRNANKLSSLQNNQILEVFKDVSEDLWVGLVNLYHKTQAEKLHERHYEQLRFIGG